MKQVITTERIPIKMWLNDIEANALQQAKNLANLPFTFKWVCLMPDTHSGYGMPIGGVISTKNVVIPYAVGSDIGCGMTAVKTSLTEIDKDTIRKIMGKIREVIPVGFNHQKENQPWIGFNSAPDIKIVQQELNSAKKQLHSLGSGNHFWELTKGNDGYIWIMIHSGSRNFGLKICKEYHSIAQRLCQKWHSCLTDNELSFLPIDSPEGKEYYVAMNFALEFAKENRLGMMENSKMVFEQCIPNIKFDEIINIHHNYAAFENHYNENVIVHRKGATSARKGEIGIIPGSQGTKSYIVRGLGNPESFTSCSHGAGRKMGRNEAKKTLNLQDEIKKLDDQGIIHGIRSINELDEASGAYKDIQDVMNNQNDLVEILVELTPLAVIKG